MNEAILLVALCGYCIQRVVINMCCCDTVTTTPPDKITPDKIIPIKDIPILLKPVFDDDEEHLPNYVDLKHVYT